MGEQLARSIRDLLADRAQSKLLLVAVDGLGGADKSTLAGHLVRRLQARGADARVVHMDDFYLTLYQLKDRATVEDA
jgi:pantothenate kinase-related protein Tda10